MYNKEVYNKYIKSDKGKEARARAAKNYYGKNKEKIENWNAEYWLIRKYNLTKAERDAMYDAQEGCCAICGIHRDMLCVDHDHSTGKVRALLCHKCNRLLGQVNDDASILYSYINYIIKYK